MLENDEEKYDEYDQNSNKLCCLKMKICNVKLKRGQGAKSKTENNMKNPIRVDTDY